MLPGMDGSPASEKPHGNSGLAREDRASLTGDSPSECRQDAAVTGHWHTSLPALAASHPHCTCCNGICCRRCATTPSAWGFLLSGTPRPRQHPLVLSTTGTDLPDFPCLAGQEQDLHVMQLQRRAAALPFPSSRAASLELCLRQGCFTGSSTTLNTLHLGNFCSQIMPERYQTPQVQLRGITAAL